MSLAHLPNNPANTPASSKVLLKRKANEDEETSNKRADLKKIDQISSIIQPQAAAAAHSPPQGAAPAANQRGMPHVSWSQGKMTHASGLIEEGEFQNGKLHGKCKVTFPNGQIKEGEAQNRKYIKASFEDDHGR